MWLPFFNSGYVSICWWLDILLKKSFGNWSWKFICQMKIDLWNVEVLLRFGFSLFLLMFFKHHYGLTSQNPLAWLANYVANLLILVLLFHSRWQKISNPRSIEQILDQVYVDHATKVDKVFSRIIETTQHPAAAASFASILFAPQGQLSFNEALSRYGQQEIKLQHKFIWNPCILSQIKDLQLAFHYRCRMNNLPICLLYGKEDPWVKPIWGLQVKRQVPEAPYYEISPAGHCPHDEVPEVCSLTPMN